MSQESRRTIEGVVKSDKMEKTVVVEVSHRVLHQTYKKFMSRKVRYKAHDDKNDCKIGDKVRIEETRPLSRGKRWRVVEIMERANIV